jgi:hypothetical protein
MDRFVIDFIDTYQEEIDNNEWSKLYTATKWEGHFNQIGQFTEALLDCGIDPLLNLTYIPGFYLLGCTHPHEIVVPETITAIHTFAFYNAGYLKRIYLPNTITRIARESFKNASAQLNGELEIIYDGTVAEWHSINIDSYAGLPIYYKVKTKEGWTR